MNIWMIIEGESWVNYLRDILLQLRVEKDDFEILRWPYMTFNDICGHTLFNKKMRLHNVKIHWNSYQNWFINKYARKKKAKISESQSHEVFQWDIEELKFLTRTKIAHKNVSQGRI